ncbi:cytochrome c oxidase subunit II [soil metagenome]
MRPCRPRRTVPAQWALLALVAVLVAGCGLTGGPQDALDPAGPVAEAQDRLWDLVFPIAVAVFVLVQGLIIVAMVRFRRRPGDDDVPRQVEGNTRLEIVWTAIPAVILAAIAVPMITTLFGLADRPEGAMDVTVVGKQYWWEFEYPDSGVVTATELHIPTDTPVWITLDGTGPDADVIHSFWVPRLAGKTDYTPGDTQTMWLQADRPGTYSGQCAEFCGLSHANMKFTVIAQEPDDFERWLAEQRQPAQPVAGGPATEGERLFSSQQCVACHVIDGYEGADQRVGPDLTHFASRASFAGGMFPTTTENLRRWLRNPPAVKPGSQMPDLNLSGSQVDALVAYLQTLE